MKNAIECRLTFAMGLQETTSSYIARNARARVLYGKKSTAIRHAIAIFEFSRQWSDVLLTDRATQDDWKKFFRDEHTQRVMRGLIRCALEAPDYLRDVVDTLIQLKRGSFKTVNDRAVALELLTAYESCGDATPPLPEIRRAFIARYGKARWPGRVSARRTLLALDIPPGKGKPGRPKGAKSKQKEYGLGRQPRKLIH